MGIVTVEKLENADKDADSLEKFVEGGRTEVVKTRKNKEYPTLENAVYQVIETGGFEPFSTEVELLASIPILEKKAAKALDTKKVWLWDGTQWNDTGLSEKDLAIAHSDAFTTDVALSVSEQTSAEFHNSDENPLEIPLIVSNGDVLLAINGEGEVMNPAPRSISFEFYNVDNNIESEYSEIDEKGFVIQNEVKSDSDLDTSKMQLNEKDLEASVIYKSNDLLKVARDHTSDFYNLEVTNSTFSTYSAIYAIIDSWMNQYPDYIFKSLIGNDDWNNPIYKYEFLSPRFVDDGEANTVVDDRSRPPRILLNSGTHGVEREAVLASVMFMNDVVNHWRENDDLASFRWATDIIFVPIVNPSGYNANTRENKNNVDINRDGVSKTQTETNLFLSVLDDYPDVDFCVDHHNSYNLSMSKRPFWVGVDEPSAFVMCRELAYEMSCYIKKEFDMYVSENTASSKLSTHISTSLTKANQEKHGVTAILLETPRQGATDVMSLKNRRIHNQYALFKTMCSVRKFILNKQFKGAAQ